MLNVGPPELLLILLIALLVLGPSKLPEAARQVGRAMAELRRLSTGFQAELREAMEEPVTRSPTPLATPAPPEPDDHEAMNAKLAEARDEAVAAARPERRREPLRKSTPTANAAGAKKKRAPAPKPAAAKKKKAPARKAAARSTAAPGRKTAAKRAAPTTKKRP